VADQVTCDSVDVLVLAGVQLGKAIGRSAWSSGWPSTIRSRRHHTLMRRGAALGHLRHGQVVCNPAALPRATEVPGAGRRVAAQQRQPVPMRPGLRVIYITG
jgi:hypothetical protein